MPNIIGPIDSTLFNSFNNLYVIFADSKFGKIKVFTFLPANLEKGTNLAAYIDELFLRNHMYSQTKTWDPEGILSTLPAIGTGILGMYIGQLLNLQVDKIEIVKKTQ